MTLPRPAVVSAGFSAVKSTAHLPRPEVRLDAAGAVGDRALCLVDVDARRVLRTVQHPVLMTVTARLSGDHLDVALPDGDRVRGDIVRRGATLTCEYWGRPVDLALLDGPHADLFSRLLGRPVRLAAAPRAGVVFAGPGVTIVGTASLRDLAQRAGHPSLPEEAARFRATLVVETDEPYAEERWLGRELAVGTATVRVTGPVPRCAVIDHHPVTGVKDARLLKVLAGYRPRNSAREPVFGVYAAVVSPGAVGARRRRNHR